MDIDAAIIGDAFYTKLITDHPAVKKLFPKEMSKQYVKLIDMLTSIVTSLNNPEYIKAEIESMAERHKEYGVKPAHYNMVGVALLWTLKEGLQSDWNHEVETAWTACYQSLASSMMDVNVHL